MQTLVQSANFLFNPPNPQLNSCQIPVCVCVFNANDGDKDKFLRCALSNFHAFPVTRFIEAKVNKTKIENTVQMHRTVEAAAMHGWIRKICSHNNNKEFKGQIFP